jgi:16S rRNA (cytosine967-C5)-methyltransferase
MSTPPDARRIAASALTSIIKQGVFATATLDRLLRAQTEIDPRDKALATEIVYGTLRTRGYLEQRLRALATRGLPRTETDLESHLLVAAYQLLFLDRVPAFAVVDAAVTAISEIAGKQPGGFANAILRKLAQSPKANLDEALVQSAPVWLADALRGSVGEDGMRGLLGCSTAADGSALEMNTLAPPPCLRLRRGAPTPEWLTAASHGRLCPEAYLVPRFGDLQQRTEWQSGHYIVQEEGAMFAGLALGARRGETILDACAGRGQKSSLIAEAIGDEGTLWATDVGEAKLRELEVEFTRLGLPIPRMSTVNWTRSAALPPDFPRHFDRILVDAPCSGTGTLRHRPEIALRLTPTDVERLATTSERLLRNLASVTGPNTLVLFVVCSVLRRECEDVLERVSDIYRAAPIPCEVAPLKGETQGRLLPHRHGTDGFFITGLQLRT